MSRRTAGARALLTSGLFLLLATAGPACEATGGAADGRAPDPPADAAPAPDTVDAAPAPDTADAAPAPDATDAAPRADADVDDDVDAAGAPDDAGDSANGDLPPCRCGAAEQRCRPCASADQRCLDARTLLECRGWAGGCLAEVDCESTGAAGRCEGGDGGEPVCTHCDPPASECLEPADCARADLPCGPDERLCQPFDWWCSGVRFAGGTCACPVPPRCCGFDADCGPGTLCARAPGRAVGVCHVRAQAGGACWSAGECAVGDACLGVRTCGCAPCAADDVPGRCVARPAGCCQEPADCPAGARCAGATPDALGRCVAPAPGATCWADDECPAGERCFGASVCGCGGCDSADRPGRCLPGPPCCLADAECGPGQVCVAPETGGACVPAPTAGTCYRHADCAAGQVCAGALAVGCRADGAPTPGVCEDLSPGCCAADRDCAGAERCVSGTDPGFFGECLPPAAPPGCWRDDECAPGEECVGEQPCGCDVDCDAGPREGTCAPADRCCASDEECGPGRVCVGRSPSDAGSCEPVLDAGRCYVDADCGDGSTCLSRPAGCLAERPGRPAPCNPGWWREGDGCCRANRGCAPGLLCAGESADTDGICRGPAPGTGCWSDVECHPGETCEGAASCGSAQGCGALSCPVDEHPGECQPAAR
jgi:hypothetical protein